MMFCFTTLLIALPVALSSGARPIKREDDGYSEEGLYTDVVIPFQSDLSFPTAFRIPATIAISEGPAQAVSVFLNMMQYDRGLITAFVEGNGRVIESTELTRFESMKDPLNSFIVPLRFIRGVDHLITPSTIASLSQDSDLAQRMDNFMIVHNSPEEGLFIINPRNPSEFLADDSGLSVALLYGTHEYHVPVDIDFGHSFGKGDGRSSRGPRRGGEGLIQLGAIDPTSHSTTLPRDLWQEFRQLLERFGSIDEKGEYFDIHDDSADYEFILSALPSLEFSVQLIDGSSHFVLPFSHKDYLVPTSTGSRLRLLVSEELGGDSPRLGHNVLNKYAILFDRESGRIGFGRPKETVIASGSTI
jgi:hypothetical protein